MQLRNIVPALAAVAAIPTAAQAFEVAGDGWNLAIEPRIQVRAEFGTASDGTNDYDPFTGTMSDDAQAWNFSVRRARVYFKGKSDEGFGFGLTMNMDKMGNKDGNASNGFDLDDAYITKSMSSDNMKHQLKFGVEQWGDYGMRYVEASSSGYLFPNGRLGVDGSSSETVGLSYSLAAPVFGIDAAIAESGSKTTGADDNSDLFVALRVSTSLKEEWATKIKESYLGKEGFGHVLSLAITSQDQGGDANTTNFGISYTVHYNQISALAEITMGTADNGAADTDHMSAVFQGGYAIPLASGKVFEPALRLTMLDNNTDNDDESAPLSGEGGDSGMYVDLGANYYIDGKSNKLQAGLQIFTAEDEGDGVIFRIQHQLDF